MASMFHLGMQRLTDLKNFLSASVGILVDRPLA
jgi:hypothetical protein